MKVTDLQQPIWLIEADLKKKEKITYIHYIQVATRLALKEQCLVNCFLIDGTNHVYRINRMTDKGNFNKPWKFEFFNPMRKIDLGLEEVSDSETLQRILIAMRTQQEE